MAKSKKHSHLPKTVASAKKIISELESNQSYYQKELLELAAKENDLRARYDELSKAKDALDKTALPFLKSVTDIDSQIRKIQTDRKYRAMWTTWNGDLAKDGLRIVDELLNKRVSVLNELKRSLECLKNEYNDIDSKWAFSIISHQTRVISPINPTIERLQDELQSLVTRQVIYAKRLAEVNGELVGLKRVLSRLEDKKVQADKGRALLASAKGKSKDKAERIKRTLQKTDWCPYCSGPLGQQPHADHIYPISKGGLSVPTNMVFVCQRCNFLKSDLTLAQFIAEYSLNRNLIEYRLRELGKHF